MPRGRRRAGPRQLAAAAHRGQRVLHFLAEVFAFFDPRSSTDWSAPWLDSQLLAYCRSNDFVRWLLIGIVFGLMRGRIQLALGHRKETFCFNWFVHCCPFTAICAFCQEARAVKASWIANGGHPIVAPQRPITATVPSSFTIHNQGTPGLHIDRALS
jgi:hypothetical protein